MYLCSSPTRLTSHVYNPHVRTSALIKLYPQLSNFPLDHLGFPRPPTTAARPALHRNSFSLEPVFDFCSIGQSTHCVSSKNGQVFGKKLFFFAGEGGDSSNSV